jgi:hypothetical protein
MGIPLCPKPKYSKNRITRRGIPRKIFSYKYIKNERIDPPYALPNASERPKRDPSINERIVRIMVILNPSSN